MTVYSGRICGFAANGTKQPMLTSDQLSGLVTQAGKVGAAKDGPAAEELLAVLLNAEDSDFAAFDLDDLKNVMAIALLLFKLGDLGRIVAVFGRCINAMQALEVKPAPADFIVPLYNLRAFYLTGGAAAEANQLLNPILNAARQADSLPDGAIRALTDLLQQVEASGLNGPAVDLYRPVYATLMASTETGWTAKLEAVARMGRLHIANGQPGDAVRIYELVLGQCEADTTGDVVGVRMLLWNLIGEAKLRADDSEGVEQAYEMAKSIAENSGNPESQVAGVIYRNLAAFWFGKSRRDRYPEAVALTLRALSIAEKLGEQQTSRYASGLGLIAKLNAGLGETAEAQRYYKACFAAFAAADDTDPSDVASFRVDEGMFLLEAGQAGDAVASFLAAREIRDAIPGSPRDELAEANGWTGVAHFENGNFADASAAFRHALDLRMNRWKDAAAQGAAP